MTKEAFPDVSLKSTKDQILAAYNQVLSKLTEKQSDSPQEKKQKEEKAVVVEVASKLTSESILKDLSTLKLRSIQDIDGLSGNLLNEFTKLTTIRHAIEEEQQHLQDLYQIKETANTLAALIQAQAEEKETFEQEKVLKQQQFDQDMNEAKAAWKKQLTTLEIEAKDRKEFLEKERKREEEDYRYTLDVKRRKELDDYDRHKAELEKDLEDRKAALDQRETNLKEQETLLNNLTLQVEEFSEVVKQAVADAEESLRSQLEKEHQYFLELKTRENITSQKLSDQKVSYLEAKIKEQDQLIKTLTQKADAATEQVQSIANRALDTSVQRFSYSLPPEEKQISNKV